MKPDLYIGEVDDRFMKRWYLLPRNRFFNIMLHKTEKNNPRNLYLHDHPFWNLSIILKGGYIEYRFFDQEKWRASSDILIGRYWGAGSFIFRDALTAHRIQLCKTKSGNEMTDILYGEYEPCWSIWICGPVRRRWGFYLPEGWVHWRKYVSMVRMGNKNICSSKVGLNE